MLDEFDAVLEYIVQSQGSMLIICNVTRHREVIRVARTKISAFESCHGSSKFLGIISKNVVVDRRDGTLLALVK
jgi:hypothetical protein